MKEKFYQFLKWSEQYTQTDMVYLAKGGFWLTLGQIISAASSFILAIAFANLLPKEIFGVYRYILSIAGILGIATLQGMNTAITQAVSRGYEGALFDGLKAKIKWGLLGGLVGLAIAGYYFFQENNTLAVGFLVVALFIPFLESIGVYYAHIQGKKRFDLDAKYGSFTQIAWMLILIIVLLLTKNVVLILLASFGSFTILRLIFFKLTLKNLPPNQNQDSEAIAYGKHLSLIDAVNVGASYLDRVLIWHYLGPAQVAIYHFSLAMPEQIKEFIKIVKPLSMPGFATRPIDEIKKTIWRRTFWLFASLVAVVSIYIIGAPLVFKIFFPQYSESIIFSQIFALSLLTTAATPFVSILESHKKIKELYIANIIGSAILIIFIFLGVYFYGLWGVIFARIGQRLFLSALFVSIFRKIKI